MVSFSERFAPYAERMRAEGMPEVVVKTFEYYYGQLVAGETGLIPEASIEPAASIPDAAACSASVGSAARDALGRTVLIKLNGGLGTSMGLDGPKSLLVVKNGLSFLEIAIRQSLRMGAPMVVMNSFATHDQTMAVLAKYSSLRTGIPRAFQQHKVPKVAMSDLQPANWPADERLQWCPPGHGDIYVALMTSGILEELLQAGYEYAFVSNIDNLGAVLDETLLGYFASNGHPFMMEVADRTEADKKGGHLARLRSGQLALREVAQCPPDELECFQDTTRHKYFNTNNLWLRLRAVKTLVEKEGPVLKLPMIRNVKPIDPRRTDSPKVYQLETAMGAAIQLFEGATAIRVPRTRLAPVKTTEDLLKVRSDAYCLTEGYQVVPNPGRKHADMLVDLDSTYYGSIDNLDAHFPYGAPSLIECERLEVRGDIKFGRNVRLVGKVRLINESAEQLEVEDGALIDGHTNRAIRSERGI